MSSRRAAGCRTVPVAAAILVIAASAWARPDGLDAFESRRLFVVPGQESHLQQIELLAPLVGTDREPRRPGDPAVYELPVDRSREELVAAARALRNAAPQLIEHAGVIVVPAGGKAQVLMTDELRVRFGAPPTPVQLRAFLGRHSLEAARAVPFRPTDFFVRIRSNAPGSVDAAGVVDDIEADPLITRVHPDYWLPIERRDDDYLSMQWHLANTGQDGGTAGADAGFEQAWGFATGNGVVVAVSEFGFEAHPCLTLWVNHGEIGGDGVDDDANTYVDDVHGWDFFDHDTTLEHPTNIEDTEHGTAVAGIVGAHRVGGGGVEGGAPAAQVMILRLGGGAYAPGSTYELAFDYARRMGADVFNASWGPKAEGVVFSPFFFEAIADLAETGRDGSGCPVVFAMVNATADECLWSPTAPVADDHVIAVASCTNFEERFDRGYGFCLDLLAPSDGGSSDIVTTSTEAKADLGSRYTQSFGGNSAAAPQVSAAAALLIELRPALTAVEIQRILQDTADRIDDANGLYATVNGRSTAGTHGCGRLNAYEAARLVADPALGGRGGGDLLVRDNRLDWGNTHTASNVTLARTRGFIEHWVSPDIRVDAPPFEPAPPADAAAFEALAHENPVAGETNRIHVRVRNRGPQDVDDVTVRLLWTFAGTALPPLPDGFWEAHPTEADTSVWKPVGTATIAKVGYSGATIAGSADDAASIVSFDWDAPAIDEAAANPMHHCLLAIVDAAADPVSADAKARLDPDAITPIDNNIAQRNLIVVDPAATETLAVAFLAANPAAEAAETWLTVASDGIPLKLVDVAESAPMRLEAGETRSVQVDVLPGGAPGDRAVITQWRAGADGDEVMGGLTFEVGAADER